MNEERVAQEIRTVADDGEKRTRTLSPPSASALLHEAQSRRTGFLPKTAAALLVLGLTAVVLLQIDKAPDQTAEIPVAVTTLVDELYASTVRGAYVAETLSPFLLSGESSRDRFLSDLWNDVLDGP